MTDCSGHATVLADPNILKKRMGLLNGFFKVTRLNHSLNIGYCVPKNFTQPRLWKLHEFIRLERYLFPARVILTDGELESTADPSILATIVEDDEHPGVTEVALPVAYRLPHRVARANGLKCTWTRSLCTPDPVRLENAIICPWPGIYKQIKIPYDPELTPPRIVRVADVSL